MSPIESTRHRLGRRLARLSLVGAVASLVMAAVGPTLAGAQEVVDAPDAYSSRAFATTLQIQANLQPPPLPLEELIRIDVPHGESEMATGPFAKGRASLAHPGTTVTDGLTLACQFGLPCEDLGEFPPPFPLNAQAEYPTMPEASPPVQGETVEVPGVMSFTAGEVTATAQPTFTETVARATDFSFVDLADLLGPILGPIGALLPVLPGETALIGIGSMQAITRHELVGGSVRTTAQSLLSDVSLAAGAVHIDSLAVTSRSVSEPGGRVESTPEVEIAGVTVAGQDAELTTEGLVVAGEAIDSVQGSSPFTIPVLANLLEGLLGSVGMEVRLLGDDTVTDQATTQATASGIRLHFELDLLGLPLVGTTGVFDIVLGMAGTQASASSFGAPELGAPVLDEPSSPAVGGGEVAPPAPVVDGRTDGASPTPAPVETPAPPARPAPTEDVPASVTVTTPLELLAGAVSDRMAWLYLAWTLSVIGLALGSRTAAFRLRSPTEVHHP